MQQAVDVFRALADPTRLAVFETVARRELTVSELKGRFEVSQPAISQHLAVLRTSGLVTHRKVGRQVFYSADPGGMKPVIDWISEYRAFWQAKLPRLQALLTQMEPQLLQDSKPAIKGERK
ncbi:MAG TPA: metalloregulator ArsR/SmtB family transcription factor [Acidisarcina sp.]